MSSSAPNRRSTRDPLAGSLSGSVIHQAAVFDPVGLPGLLYWYGAYPLHRFIFAGMLRGIAARAREPSR